MGKVKRSRLDKFYQLAKNSGFRSRAAFKLLQINRRFEFLQNASILIDLCAAPGSWLQVAAKALPSSRFIIGVDLVKISPLPGVVTLQADITTNECRLQLKKLIKDEKANVVLHDGSPNVGTSWSIDEYQQAHLCLEAFKLASEFLIEGGHFITKVFRSKDYEPLKWVLSQFFAAVKTVKPEASRLESAEIYLICLRFKAPLFVDPKFFNPKHVFKDIEACEDEEKMQLGTFLKKMTDTKKRHRGGYDDNDSLFNVLPASEFLNSNDFLLKLGKANQIRIDEDAIANHELTTEAIKIYLKDIKVLGKAEIKALLKWRKLLTRDTTEQPSTNELEECKDVDDPEIELQEMMEADRKVLKRSRKKEREAAKKFAERVEMRMEHPNDKFDFPEDDEMFSLRKLEELKSQLKKHSKSQDALDIDVSAINSYADNQKREVLVKRNQQLRAHADGDGVSKKVCFNKTDSFDYEEQLLDDKKQESEEEEEECDSSGKKRPRLEKALNEEERAVATKLVESMKSRREIIESTYNRYHFAATDLPAWFMKDEQQFNRPHRNYFKLCENQKMDKSDLTTINARTSKKVVQAKARKKSKVLRKAKKAYGKACGLSDELTDKEKLLKAKQIYKKAGILKKKKRPLNLLVGSKAGTRNHGKHSKGGVTKVVDRKMKADMRTSRRGKPTGKRH